MVSWRKLCGSITGIMGILFVFIVMPFNLLPLGYQLPIFTSLFLIACFFFFPLARQKDNQPPFRWIDTIDILLVILSLVITGYLIANYEALIYERPGLPIPSDIVMGVISIVLVMESLRRAGSLVLVILVSLFLFYAFCGQLMPTFIVHRGYSLGRVVTTTYLTKSGIYGIPIQVMLQYVSLFVVFGAVLEISGGAKFIIDLAKSIAGRITGGLAMVAVLASTLMGTISGTAVANVATTGSVTIPSMKRGGYEPEFAGAVESVASTGGQLVPPIMGAAAFLMADALGIPYLKVAAAAIIPAFLYYFALFAAIYIYARRIGLRGKHSEDLPEFFSVMKRGYYLLPVLLLIGMLVLKYSPTMAGVAGVTGTFFLCFLNQWLKGNYNPWDAIKLFIEGMNLAARAIGRLVPISASAGIVVGIITLTGLGPRLSSMLVTISGGNSFILLLLSAVVGLIMGMGMPTTAVYIVLSALIVPALSMSGMNLLASHLFIFYFGMLSMITPPVALAAYTASAIAGCEPNRVGWISTKLAIPIYLLPFVFVYCPALVLEAPLSQAVLPTIIAAVGSIFVACSMQGFMLEKINGWQRVLAGIGGILLIDSNYYRDLIGIAMITIAIFPYFLKQKSHAVQNEYK